jgi:hypothetical protein
MFVFTSYIIVSETVMALNEQTGRRADGQTDRRTDMALDLGAELR